MTGTVSANISGDGRLGTIFVEFAGSLPPRVVVVVKISFVGTSGSGQSDLTLSW
jgi:hypothetical protein